MNKRVEMFTSEHCAPCRVAKGFFQSNGIEYHETDVDSLPTHVREVFSVPTIICKNEDDSVALKFEGFSVCIVNKIAKWYKA